MTTTTDAVRLAQESADKPQSYFCNKCYYFGPDGPEHPGCDYLAYDYNSSERKLARALLSALAVVEAARELRDDVRRRFQNQSFYCGYMRAMDEALCDHDASTEKDAEI
jgi:hypothetical protein